MAIHNVDVGNISPADSAARTSRFRQAKFAARIEAHSSNIYVGDNKMLHCGDPIQYADITSSYWTQHFYAFGRLS